MGGLSFFTRLICRLTARIRRVRERDRETLVLYGYIEVEDPAKWDESADTAINRKWWDFMADIMETNPDNSPVSVDLHEVFHLD